MAVDPEAIAKTFVAQYYQTFDTNRAALGGLYVSVRYSRLSTNHRSVGELSVQFADICLTPYSAPNQR